ncbi:MAG: ferrochelatase, partial [bacterium]
MMPASPRRQRLAIVLFNLGGPDAPESVRPFLVNLFTDPAILRVPGFVRPWLGRLIAWRRTKPAQENYAVLGGRSPLRELTEEQASSLEAALANE